MSPPDTAQLYQELVLVGEDLNVDRFPLKSVCACARCACVLNTHTNAYYTALRFSFVLTLVTNEL